MKVSRKYKVALDPGHGTSELNQSPDGRYFEYKFAWDLANRLKKLLEDTGKFEVLVTKQTEGETPTPSSRAKLANDWGADIFISVHSNAVGTGVWVDETHGLTTWTYEKGGNRDVLAKLVLEEMAERGVELFGSQLYHARFTVLVNTVMPAILIEHLFRTCRSDVDKLVTSEWRDKFAYATLKAVKRYFNIDDSEDDVFYRVQVGAFEDEDNAVRMEEMLNEQGFDSIIVPVEK